MPFYRFWGGFPPTRIDYRKKGTLILTSLLEDLKTGTFPNDTPLAQLLHSPNSLRHPRGRADGRAVGYRLAVLLFPVGFREQSITGEDWNPNTA